MRIAFASCMCTRVFKNQPVWDHIASQKPDVLVLLGDSIYLDIMAPTDPQAMSDDDFAQHLFALYSELLVQVQFVKLVKSFPLGRVYSIWDDHDFLWNDAFGAQASANPQHAGKVRLTTAFQTAFRQTLAKGFAPGSFPSAYNDPIFWTWPSEPLPTESIALSNDVWLHLSDVRTHRTTTWLRAESKRSLLGDQQRQQFSKRILASAPDSVHLFASGSTLAGWKRYSRDLKWLHDLAAERRTLVLSGDIHRNEVDAFHTGGWPLHEATSSGAAVRDAVLVGSKQENHGMLILTDQALQVRMFRKGAQQIEHNRNISKQTWLLM